MLTRTLTAAALVVVAVLAGSAQQLPDPAAGILASIDADKDRYAAVAKQIWDFAELGYQEERSSALLQKTLADAGFTVSKGAAGMPTAFTATYGSGKPVIVLMGEFDALPGLSQRAGDPARSPVTVGSPGHGCGHNLLGTASAAAAIAVKAWLQQGHRAGTVRYYGSPAEEGGGGKVYMVRAGLFSDVDAVIGWHPGDQNQANPASSLATIAATFRFYGTAAHAAASPDRGRSALDGVEAFDYMINMMREHVPQETRIHYIIKKGGVASNIVPDYAEGEYQARHPDMRTLEGIWDRILKAAEGAAMGTGTRVEHEVITSYWNVLPNETLSAVQYRSLQRVGGFDYTPDEQAFAEKIRATLISPATPMGAQKAVQPMRTGLVGSASTDMGDVSWNVPTAQMGAATFSPGVPAHSWQAVACAGMSIGAKGMLVAAKTMALTVTDLMQNPATLAKAKEEFLQKRGGAAFKYTSVAGATPPFDFRK
ncbi:MAG TPA: amidohydrolase [Vicinamibacterales bacterium]|jgi:aminobenzoyl-glutamate utilization protein B